MMHNLITSLLPLSMAEKADEKFLFPFPSDNTVDITMGGFPLEKQKRWSPRHYFPSTILLLVS
jgi:hypothetical protein